MSGVVFNKEVLGLHVDGDVDLLGFLSVGTVLLIQTGDAVSTFVHRASELTVM